ncbi:hypothetical protein WMY93_002807 [Mugilogobius chulae]|uniref:PAS domain-containing protein n=1 Tax=Mugilogobius chulae TaxID=88201 RepID=A0AAW0Q0N9_9GOBI
MEDVSPSEHRNRKKSEKSVGHVSHSNHMASAQRFERRPHETLKQILVLALPVMFQRAARSRGSCVLGDAARCRRSQETEIFYELAPGAAPAPPGHHAPGQSRHHEGDAELPATAPLLTPDIKSEESEDDPMDQFYPQVLGGFIMVLCEEGDILELLGQSLFEFVHPCDQEELRDLLTTRSGVSRKQNSKQPTERSFFLRMKNTLTSRGRTVNLKSATWKVLHCTGHMRSHQGSRVLSLLCEPLPHPSSVEFPLDSSTLLTRHSMDLRFTHCEGRVLELLGYEAEHLIGCSAYHFYHALDFDHISTSLQTLLSKGQVRTRQYRFLARPGGFVWVETQATVLYSRSGQPDAIVCLNFILSAIEQPDVVFSVEQRCADMKGEPVSSVLQEPLTEPLTEPLSEPCSPAQDAGLNKLSFSSPKPDCESRAPQDPQDLCSPALRQLLSPIFNTPPSSCSPTSSPEHQAVPEVPSPEEPMDTSGVERFFAMWPDADKDQGRTLLHMDDMDLDMLAPYISMDDDFQLSALSAPEEVESPAGLGSVGLGSGRRKRVLSVDTELLPEKRLKGLTEEEELLGCLQESDQSKRGWNQLLTDKDPVLGGVQSERAGLMAELFLSRHGDLSPPLSPMT